MDKLTLSPDESGYSFKDGIEVLRAQLDSGSGRFSRGILNASFPLNVQWTCDEDEYDYLMEAHATHVSEGYAPFPIDLIIDTNLFVEHRVRMMPGSFGLASHTGRSYVMKATLEVEPTPKALFLGDIPKFNLRPDKNGYAFQMEAVAIHQPLEGGLGRTYNDQIGVTTKINMKWTTNVAGFLYFREFYRRWVTKPDAFPMDLFLQTHELEEHNVWFVPGSVGLDSISGQTFVLSAQIEVDTDESINVPVAAYFFDEFFNDSEGDVELGLHVPDVAPEGFSWGGGEGGDLVVTSSLGDGEPTEARNAESGYNDLSNTSNAAPGAWAPMPVGDAWRMEMRTRAGNGNSEYAPGSVFRIYTLEDGVSVTIEWHNFSVGEGFNGSELRVRYTYGESAWEGAIFGYPAYEEVFISLTVDADGIYVSVDNEFALALGVTGSSLSHFDAMRQVELSINNGDEDDAAVGSVGVYPNAEPVAANVVKITTVDLAHLYAYQADVEAVGFPETFPADNWFDAGSDVITSVGNKYALFLSANQSAGGDEHALGGDNYAVVEFTVEKVAPGSMFAVGLFPVGGPSFNPEAAYCGNKGVSAYWAMNGDAGGYGDSDNTETPFSVGQVIGVMYNALGDSNEIRFYLDGVYQFTYLPLNTTVRPFATVIPMTDPYFSSVTALLHFDTYPVLEDSSVNIWSISTSNIVQSTDVYRFGGSATESNGLADGAAVVINLPPSVLYAKGVPMTVEFWLNVRVGNTQYFCGQDGTSYFSINNEGHLAYTGSSMAFDFGILEEGVWTHIAISVPEDGENAMAFRDGVFMGDATMVLQPDPPADGLGIVNIYARPDLPCLDGYMDDFRWTTGVARYTDAGGFTPPTAPFPDA